MLIVSAVYDVISVQEHALFIIHIVIMLGVQIPANAVTLNISLLCKAVSSNRILWIVTNSYTTGSIRCSREGLLLEYTCYFQI